MLVGSKSVVGLVVAATIFSNSFFLENFPTVADIPSNFFQEQKYIFAKVERVIDGDTIRVRHCPTRFSCPRPDKNVKRIYDSTMSIRLYGVDCPELQKRKTEGQSQPYADEAKRFTSDSILGEKVRIKLLRKDQYGRAVGRVETSLRILPPFGRRDLSLELIRRGLASIYTGGGAEYDGNRCVLQDAQGEAERGKRGLWSQGDDITTPAEYKRQQKLQKLMKQADLAK